MNMHGMSQWLLLLAVLGAMDTAVSQTTSEPPPNIIFIFADDLGWGDLGSYGNPQIQTPHLDELAKEGSLYTNFYVNSPVCSPSRAAVMTGQFPSRNRVFAHFAGPDRNAERSMPNYLDPSLPTLTGILQEAGYTTGHFGKWHLGSGEGAPSPGAYGIDEHLTTNSTGPKLSNEGDPSYFRAKSTAYIVDAAIDFIKRHRGQLFYLNLWTLIPHATLNPTEQQMEPFEQYGPAGVPYKGATQIYYASVTAMDSAIGRLLARLDEMDLAEETIVIFSSDNGPESIYVNNASHSAAGSAGPFRGRKRSLYEGGVRAPFIVRWPGHVPAGEVDNTSIVSAVDLLPTLAHFAGTDVSTSLDLDGENVSDILLGTPEPRGKSLFWDYRFQRGGSPFHISPQLAIREASWKLLMNPDSNRIELYHIPTDPMEMNNRAAERPDLVRKLSRNLLNWRATLPEGPVQSKAGRQRLYRWKGIPLSN